eukprot:8933500-Lingulodinium_polyedra.AAC.1
MPRAGSASSGSTARTSRARTVREKSANALALMTSIARNTSSLVMGRPPISLYKAKPRMELLSLSISS